MTRRTPGGHPVAGFSLIELVAVLAVFALVATMGLQALSGTMRTRDRLTAIDAETRALSRAMALLRQDLARAAPLEFHRPGVGKERPFTWDPALGLLSVSTAGRGALPGEPAAGLARVEWRYDPVRRRLERRVWPTLIPADPGLAGAATVLLDDLSGFDVAVHTPRDGWQPATAEMTYGETGGLPPAVELRLTHRRFGPLLIRVTP